MEKRRFLDEQGLAEVVDLVNLQKMIVDVGDVTLNAEGYLDISWSSYGVPSDCTVEAVTVYNYGKTSPVGAFNVGFRHIFGQANMKITRLSVILLVRKS